MPSLSTTNSIGDVEEGQIATTRSVSSLPAPNNRFVEDFVRRHSDVIVADIEANNSNVVPTGLPFNRSVNNKNKSNKKADGSSLSQSSKTRSKGVGEDLGKTSKSGSNNVHQVETENDNKSKTSTGTSDVFAFKSDYNYDDDDDLRFDAGPSEYFSSSCEKSSDGSSSSFVSSFNAFDSEDEDEDDDDDDDDEEEEEGDNDNEVASNSKNSFKNAFASKLLSKKKASQDTRQNRALRLFVSPLQQHRKTVNDQPQQQQQQQQQATVHPQVQRAASTVKRWNTAELEMLEYLSSRYRRRLEERQIGYVAKYRSMRETAMVWIVFMFCLQLVAVTYMVQVWDISITDAVLYSAYTVTTAGFGSVKVPNTETRFLVFAIFFVFIGISAMAVMVAQMYQYLTFESLRMRHVRHKIKAAKIGLQQLTSLLTNPPLGSTEADDLIRRELHKQLRRMNRKHHKQRDGWKRIKNVLTGNEGRKVMFVAGVLISILLVETFGVMILEGWNFLDSLYFSVYCMTTVGYGDIVPKRTRTVWFVTVWLYCSVPFVALYLGTIAHLYMYARSKNTERIEDKLRRKGKEEQERPVRNAAQPLPSHEITAPISSNLDQTETSNFVVTHELAERGVPRRALSDDENSSQGELSEPPPIPPSSFALKAMETGSVYIARSPAGRRRKFVRELSNLSFDEDPVVVSNLPTMRALINRVHHKLQESANSDPTRKSSALILGTSESNEKIVTAVVRADYTKLARRTENPSLALRVLVHERLAEIIATDFAGFRSNVKIHQSNTLVLTIEAMQLIIEKWHIPTKAHHAFKSVVFDVIVYVGAYDLIRNGAEAIFRLTPEEFGNIFTPFVVSIGEVAMMEEWLKETDHVLSMQRTLEKSSATYNASFLGLDDSTRQHEDEFLLFQRNSVLKECVDEFFPIHQGNAIPLRVR